MTATQTTPIAPSSHPWRPELTFGVRLRLVRHQLGLSIEEIAGATGLPYATWRTWEHGSKPRNMGEVVARIAETVGVDRDWLMWGGETPTRWWSGTPGLELVPGTGAASFAFVKQLSFFPHALRRATDHAP